MAEKATRDSKGRFLKGVSGNPGGNRTAKATALRLAKRLDPMWLQKMGPAGQAILQWIDQVTDDLGGADQVSVAKQTLLQRAGITLALLSMTEAELMKQPDLKTDEARQFIRDRKDLLYSLQSTLNLIGLDKVAPPPKSLTEIMAQDFQQQQQPQQQEKSDGQ